MDGTPTVILEAMALGRAVIASDLSGIPELVRHDVNGLLVQAGDVAELAARMRQLVQDDYLFLGVPVEFDAGRYHSWVVEHDTLPAELEITVENDEGYIMAIRHRKHDVKGVQFHPESVLTEYGGKMIMNWLNES
jgi:anthranilate/para-aminobenzoate synthase component II